MLFNNLENTITVLIKMLFNNLRKSWNDKKTNSKRIIAGSVPGSGFCEHKFLEAEGQEC